MLQGSVDGVSKWLLQVLVLLRVIIGHSKEDTVVARLRELGVRLFACRAMVGEHKRCDADPSDSSPPNAHPLLTSEIMTKRVDLPAEQLLAQLLLQMTSVVGGEILEQRRRLPASDAGTDFLCQQMAHFLLTVVYMLQSGSFRKTLAALKQVMTSSHTQSDEKLLFAASDANDVMRALSCFEPTLTLQWCNVLVLLGVDDVTFWHRVMMSERRVLMSDANGERYMYMYIHLAAVSKT